MVWGQSGRSSLWGCVHVSQPRLSCLVDTGKSGEQRKMLLRPGSGFNPSNYIYSVSPHTLFDAKYCQQEVGHASYKKLHGGVAGYRLHR